MESSRHARSVATFVGLVSRIVLAAAAVAMPARGVAQAPGAACAPTGAHAEYAARGISCDRCHACGAKLPGGHTAAWMDRASTGFHALDANRALASCTSCHGARLDGVGKTVTIACVDCHGVGWERNCTLCHGDPARPDGAPPRVTWGKSADPVRAGAHASHVQAAHRLSAAVGCGACHIVPEDALSPGHADGEVATVTFGPDAVRGTVVPAAWDRGTATCTGTYCHGATLAAGGTSTAPVWTKVDGTQAACDACHGAPPPAPHPPKPDCAACHAGYGATTVNAATHVDGKLDVAAMTCTSCHGSVANAAPPESTLGETATTSRAVGAHQSHLAGGIVGRAVACEECHVVPGVMDHATGTVELAWGPLAIAGGALPVWDATAATCSSTYCHGGFAGGNLLNAPSWVVVDGSQSACGTCHGLPPPPPHPSHPACGNCHTGYTATSVNVATHVDGVVDVGPMSCTSCHGDPSRGTAAPPYGTHGETDPGARAVGAHGKHLEGGAIGPAVACAECHEVPGAMDHRTGAVELAFGALARTGGATPTWNAATLTCAGTWCHGSMLRGGGTNQAPRWTGGGAEAGCGACHGVPPPAPHPHTAVCDTCHPGYTPTSVNPAQHLNGVVEATNLTCSSCHGDNARVLVSQADALAVAAPPYGSRGETASTTRAVGAHLAHVNRGNGVSLPNKCRYCHAVPIDVKHANGVSEIAFESLATMGGATPTFDGDTCGNTYCHGATLGRGGTNHAPRWSGGPDQATCGSCHGVPPPEPHPQDPDCIRCHPGYTATSVRRATHVNGISDFPNGCNSCHDDPPASGEHYEHLHERIPCSACHAGYTATSENPTLHRNAKQDVTLAGWDPVRRTCSNVSCHGSEYWGRNGGTATRSCNQCHGVPPGSGEHFEHSEYGCDRCHGAGYSTTTTNPATHMNGTVDVPVAFYSRDTRTCTSACHRSEAWGPRGEVTMNCGNCHGFPPPAPHPQDSACSGCHPSMAANGTLDARHNDGNLDISGQGCASCHGFPPTRTRTGAAHTTDTHCYGCHSTTVDATNQVVPDGTHNDGAVQVGGGGVGTYGCQSCHGDQARSVPAGSDPNLKAAPPLGTRGETDQAARAVGAHLAHVTGASAAGAATAPIACAECHVVPSAMDHANGSTVITWGARATAGGAVAPSWDGARCASTYCHGATLGAGGTSHTPLWTGGAAEASCGSCHGAPPPAPHPSSPSCGGCHEGYTGTTVNAAAHVDGQVQVSAMACTSCHGSAANAAPPFGTNGESATTTIAVGAHQAHLAGGALAHAIACGECHLVPTSMQHATGAVELTWGALATAGGAMPAWDRASATCSNAYCHGRFTGGNALNAPSWITVDGSQAVCGSCHGLPPPAPHVASTACGSCHPGYTATSVDLDTHVDGMVQATSYHPAGWSDRAQHGYSANTTGLSGCKSCHGADLAGGTSGVGCAGCHASAGWATWDTSCTFCHGDRTSGTASPPVDIQGRSATSNVSVGLHASHVGTTIANPIACTECHPARSGSVIADAAHVDGNGIAEVAFGGLARTGGLSPTYTRTSATSATCASTYCHGRFSGGTSASVGWTSTIQVGCSSCHGNPPGTGRHGTHASKSVRCTNCHSSVVGSTGTITNRANHLNGSKQVVFGGTYSSRTVTGTWSASTRSCSNLSCHGSQSW